MNPNHLNPDWQVRHPFRAFWRGFAALSILVVAPAPFKDTLPSRWLFLFGGLGYCAALSFFAVGICLLPGRVRFRTLIGLSACAILGVLLMLAIFLTVRSGRLEALDLVFPVARWVFGIVIFALFTLALCGWCHRILNDRTKVA